MTRRRQFVQSAVSLAALGALPTGAIAVGPMVPASSTPHFLGGAVIDSLAVMGLVAQGSAPEAMDRSQKEEFTRWGPLVKKTGFTAEP